MTQDQKQEALDEVKELQEQLDSVETSLKTLYQKPKSVLTLSEVKYEVLDFLRNVQDTKVFQLDDDKWVKFIAEAKQEVHERSKDNDSCDDGAESAAVAFGNNGGEGVDPEKVELVGDISGVADSE